MRHDEIIFVVEDSLDGGLEARALGHSIYSEAETPEELREMLRDAVRCHFEEDELPRMIRLHWVRDEVLAV
ncbi:MAG: 2-oxoisovalerate dehydrogenase [Rubrobacter sp.]|jgi:hypothetical protein|nr:2-oxoisovalerate dehydrogenase [Rubrobacter sp.]